jgi:hypothetical protein
VQEATPSRSKSTVAIKSTYTAMGAVWADLRGKVVYYIISVPASSTAPRQQLTGHFTAMN